MDPDCMEPLGASENLVFRARTPSGTAILRLTHRGHRAEDALEGERRFIDACCAAGIRACACEPARDGRAVVPIGADWLAMRFRDAAREASVPRAEPWTAAQLRSWGRAVGGMHALAARMPSMPARPHWRAERILQDALRDADSEVRARAAAIVQGLEERQGGESELVLIHADLHQGNLARASDGSVHIFDFDDCRYHFPMYDLAICASYMPEGDGDDVARRRVRTERMRSFLDGYAEAHRPPRDAELMDRLMRLRDIEMFAWIQARDGGTPSQRTRDGMARRRPLILAGHTPVDAQALLR